MIVVPIDVGGLAVWVELEFDDRLGGDHQRVAHRCIDSPSFGWNPNLFSRSVLVGQQNDNRHHQAPDISKLKSVKSIGVGQQLFFMFGHLLERFLISSPLLVGHGSGIVLVVEILELRELIGSFDQLLVSLLRERRQLCLFLVLLVGCDFIRRAAIDHVDVDLVQRDIAVVGGIEPTSPEPIKIPGCGVFHRPEEIRRHRTLELPSTRVLLERKIEKLSP